MTTLLDLLLFIANVVLVVFSVKNMMLVLTGTTRNYLEWSQGLGGFLFIAAILLNLLHLDSTVPGYNLNMVIGRIGLAFMVLPYVLHWLAPSLYRRLEDC